jgi:hypothetical protein
MNKTDNPDVRKTDILIPLVAVLSVITLVVIFSVKAYNSVYSLDPESVVREYVTALSDGDCKNAFSMVSSYLKDYDTNYGSLDSFNKNVCGQIRGKYSSVRVQSVEPAGITSDMATVHLRLKLKPTILPQSIDRTILFDLRREGKKWHIDGPSLDF